ncbi:hypothetical protein A3E65_00095 [Candidatus Kaiserbacteria bacterium RIFCSPHIGHO2_12_FULL_56_13]|uniref:Uncharacterized protein n=1 Tax=Candidatus Kaiserbacteria bacterium RIFCSPHIGHO2_12_FULL_56_13 TaxID=1798505 RepID=A0A1F6EEZ9_9BACT|nr:MAG: hypothetical protein A3E65_00095 [Candidatus Kaiserbacteria bacterium RIFCSPHIGHO2_12_FULL_56_13]
MNFPGKRKNQSKNSPHVRRLIGVSHLVSVKENITFELTGKEEKPLVRAAQEKSPDEAGIFIF